MKSYVLGVKITDGGGLTSTMNVTITIGGVQEPVFGSNVYSLDEAIKGGPIPQFTTNNQTGFQALATDPEGDSPLTWKFIW